MKKLMAGVAAFAAITMLTMVQPAAAHDFDGGGDCDGWTLELDGTYGAHHIYIDGVAQATVKLTYTIPDGSDDESRSFTVKWDKDSNDVTKTHTLERDTDKCGPPPCEDDEVGEPGDCKPECPYTPGIPADDEDCQPPKEPTCKDTPTLPECNEVEPHVTPRPAEPAPVQPTFTG
jgi:hypothetical protein